MARESFEDENVAELLNEHFLCVKVDKEERPDIDGIYMRACQAATGSGGWPTSLFLTPDKLPFFAGTYFPKPAFMHLIETLGGKWRSDPAAAAQSGRQLVIDLRREGPRRWGQGGAPVTRALSQLKRGFDPQWGGFSPAPKFPTPHVLLFLLATEPDMAYATLNHMARGGIFDHIGYGFCRYSTDRKWLLPHFEKMLYDNSLIAIAYLHAYEKSELPFYRKTAEQTLSYMQAELLSEDSGFYAAQDADTEGEEGKFYLLSEAEIQDLLGKADGKTFARAYNLTGGANPREPRVPNLIGLPDPPEQALRGRERVHAYRKARARLDTDCKMLTAWNAMAVWALADAARILGAFPPDGCAAFPPQEKEAYLQTARQTADFLHDKLFHDGVLHTAITRGTLGAAGFLDDYAYLALADLALYQATAEEPFLTRAKEVANMAADLFWDEAEGGFFFSGAQNEALFLRPKELYDGAVPSGNSVMAMVLARLAVQTDDEKIKLLLTAQRSFMNRRTWDYSAGHAYYLLSTLPTRDTVCAPGPDFDPASIHLRSNQTLRIVRDDPAYPLLNERTTFYTCENGTCFPPANER